MTVELLRRMASLRNTHKNINPLARQHRQICCVRCTVHTYDDAFYFWEKSIDCHYCEEPLVDSDGRIILSFYPTKSISPRVLCSKQPPNSRKLSTIYSKAFRGKKKSEAKSRMRIFQRVRNSNSKDASREEDFLPEMVKSPANSLSSSEEMNDAATAGSSQDYAATERIHQRFSSLGTQLDLEQRREITWPQSRRSEPEISNRSILMGAEIIKRQLSIDAPSRVRTHRRRNTHYASNAAGQSAIDRDDWDPWKTDSTSREDENTAQLLEKANSILEASKASKEQRNDILPKTSLGGMVQRVSEMDNSTFASSSSENASGYLPRNLLSTFGCGTGFNIYGDPEPKEHILSIRPDCDFETKTLDDLTNAVSQVEETQLNLCSMPHTSPVRQQRCPPKVTEAAKPFERMISPRSSFHEELEQDPGFQHALKAGTLWQSLCSQHVRFPAHWWDGQEPIGPPLGSIKKAWMKWNYLGRHRVQADYKLNSLIGNRGSSGRILLHVIVRDALSGEPIEDIACGCFHPNARGVRAKKDFDPRYEDCRDVWIAHRKRTLVESTDDKSAYFEEDDNEYSWTTIESILRHQNKGRVDASPLGPQGGKKSVTNDNLKAIFGSKPPVFTVFVGESELYELFQSRLDGSIPASVALLRHYLKYRIG